jgi:hypothetical protein
MLIRITLAALSLVAWSNGALANGPGRCDVCGFVQAKGAYVVQPASIKSVAGLRLLTPSIPIPPPVRGR